MMLTPPAIAHNRIAGKLQRLLNEALDHFDASRLATQRPNWDRSPTGRSPTSV
jgi:hypothetical protein